MAGKHDFVIETGATFDRTLKWTVPVSPGSKQRIPRNLTGWTARMQVRQRVTDAAALLTLSTTPGAPANGLIELGGAAGTIRLLIDGSVTGTVAANAGVYDLFLTDPTSNEVRLMAGEVVFEPRVTR